MTDLSRSLSVLTRFICWQRLPVSMHIFDWFHLPEELMMRYLRDILSSGDLYDQPEAP